jgi:hypothetical protein
MSRENSPNTDFGELDQSVKAPSPTEIPLNPVNAIPDALPQERVTGDILRGYGPRRGNLERLLRYWRPIMRREGGFRRCLAILADHPELYPLEPLCAWLHHETTGLWPNEGCHHPGMKNCRRKLKRVVRGSLFSDAEFNDRLDRIAGGKLTPRAPGGRLPSVPGKSYDSFGDTMSDEDDLKGMGGEMWPSHDIDDDEMVKEFVWALKGFMDDEPKWVAYLRDDNNWEHIGEDEDGYASPHQWTPGQNQSSCGCGGACGGAKGCGGHDHGGWKSLMEELELDIKVGKPLSARNVKRIRDAITALTGILDDTGNGMEMKEAGEEDIFIDADTTELFELKGLLDPVIEFHGLDAEVYDDGILVKGLDLSNDDAYNAVATMLDAYDDK